MPLTLLFPVSTGSRRMSLRGRRLSIPIAEREQHLHDKDIDESLHDHALQHTASKTVDKKDFTAEVRGARDISNFLEKSSVVLDMNETELEPIVDKLLDAMDDGEENVGAFLLDGGLPVLKFLLFPGVTF